MPASQPATLSSFAVLVVWSVCLFFSLPNMALVGSAMRGGWREPDQTNTESQVKERLHCWPLVVLVVLVGSGHDQGRLLCTVSDNSKLYPETYDENNEWWVKCLACFVYLKSFHFVLFHERENVKQMGSRREKWTDGWMNEQGGEKSRELGR